MTTNRRKSGRAQCIEKLSGTSVENWRLRPVHRDRQVVDAMRSDSRENMLDSVNGARISTKLRLPFARRHLIYESRNRIARDIGPNENNALP
jgi:hypothetical protein